jgi:hypothetical protein
MKKAKKTKKIPKTTRKKKKSQENSFLSQEKDKISLHKVD